MNMSDMTCPSKRLKTQHQITAVIINKVSLFDEDIICVSVNLCRCKQVRN